jgi:protein phosphatase 2C family protein 2/3
MYVGADLSQGIWDCLTSQQVVNIVRRKVADGMELTEISELLCQHCLAPDTSSGAGIGCDNMTAMVVAILNGRTKDEWYAWMADRVKRQVGYPTPPELPQLYAPTRIQAFQARQRAREEREERERQNGGGPRQGDGSMGSLLGGQLGGTLGGFARVLGSAGGLTFNPASGIMSDPGTLMFDKYDSDEDEDEGEVEEGSTDVSSFFGNSFGSGISNTSLRAQLAALDDEDDDAEMDTNDDTQAQKSEGKASASEETPPPPASSNSADDIKPQKQLEAIPAGDAPAPAVKAEGLLDKSEDPLKQ